jgi:hypothetical protein
LPGLEIRVPVPITSAGVAGIIKNLWAAWQIPHHWAVDMELMVVVSDKIFAIIFNLVLVILAHAISATVRAGTLIFWPQYMHSLANYACIQLGSTSRLRCRYNFFAYATACSSS